MNKRPDLIESLTADFRPSSRLRGRDGQILVATSLAITIALAGIEFARPSSLASGLASPVFVMANGLLLLLGIVCALAAVNMAQPRVGKDYSAPMWVMATLSVLPLSAAAATVSGGSKAAIWSGHHDAACLGLASVFAVPTAVVLLYWLRRGAPVSTERAGLITGVAAGAMGSFGYGLFCPILTVAHLGVWHVVPVAMWGILGRVAFPSLLRW